MRKRSRYSSTRLAAAVGDVLADGHVREERVLLEDEPDAPLVRLAEEPCRRVEPRRRRRARSGPPRAAASPATARSTEVLPAPDGPTSATVPVHRQLDARAGTSAAEGRTRPRASAPCVRPRPSARRASPRPPGHLHGHELQRQQDREADDHEQRADRERDRRSRSELERRVDGERERLRPALEAAREHDRGAELAEAAGERDRLAGREAGARERQRHAEERPDRPGAERARGGDEVRVDRLERGDRLPDVERAGHEHDREDDREPG